MGDKNNKIIKTVLQYSKELSPEVLTELKNIAVDYNKVKNYVYGRYSGVNSIEKLTPGYTVMNEMRYCGLRQELNLPVVYYELAILDALKNIKSMWSNLKNKIAVLIRANDNLTKDDKVYLLTALKFSTLFYEILTRKEHNLPKNAEGLKIDTKRLDNLLCRYVRKHKVVPKVQKADYFMVSPMGYKYYQKGVIGFVSRVPRKRIKIELKDKDIHTRQLRISFKDNCICIVAPIETTAKHHNDYTNTIYVNIGFTNIFVLSNGNIYGANFNKFVNFETDRLKNKNIERYKVYKSYVKSIETGEKNKSSNIIKNNMGKKKYLSQKKSNYEKMTTFINTEINRLLKNEKPCKIVIRKAIKKKKASSALSRYSREKLSRNFEGYIRKRLKQKCELNDIELIEVTANEISSICSNCGEIGKKQNVDFICSSCGLKINRNLNSAKNIEKRYLKLD